MSGLIEATGTGNNAAIPWMLYSMFYSMFYSMLYSMLYSMARVINGQGLGEFCLPMVVVSKNCVLHSCLLFVRF